MTYTLRKPQIQPAHTYKLKLKSKNCGLYSNGDSLVVMAAGVPSTSGKPYVLSYDSVSSMTIRWAQPDSNGGHPVTSYTVYLDDTPLVSLNPSLNYYTLDSLTLG
jgi:hypothetical protein